MEYRLCLMVKKDPASIFSSRSRQIWIIEKNCIAEWFVRSASILHDSINCKILGLVMKMTLIKACTCVCNCLLLSVFKDWFHQSKYIFISWFLALVSFTYEFLKIGADKSRPLSLVSRTLHWKSWMVFFFLFFKEVAWVCLYDDIIRY